MEVEAEVRELMLNEPIETREEDAKVVGEETKIRAVVNL